MRVVGIGDNVVDRYLSQGQMYPGGNALNVAVFARRAGAEAAYIGALGDDAAGRLVLRALRDEGIDVSRVRVVPGPNAYANVALVDGDRRFGKGDAGVSRFVPNAADLALMRGCDLVHSSIYSDLEQWVCAMRGELSISFDFSDQLARPLISTLAPGLFCALFSGARLSPAEAEDLVRWTVSLGARMALVTRGADGVIACIDDRCWMQPAHPAHIVDTLGAGDAFLAAFLLARLDGTAPAAALSRGAEAAAAACAYVGAFGRGGPLDRAQIPEPIAVEE